jgi:ribosomal protein L12E/L44/L45/RPP1/RPP2
MDDVRDGLEEMSEVNEVLAQGFGDQMDESELLDEFEQLEEELLDEQLMDISAPAVGVPAQAAADPAVPAAAASAPAPAPEPAASTEEDEFAQLEAQMVRLSPRHTRTHAPTHHAVTLSGLIFDRRFGPVPGNVTMDMCARVVCG